MPIFDCKGIRFKHRFNQHIVQALTVLSLCFSFAGQSHAVVFIRDASVGILFQQEVDEQNYQPVSGFQLGLSDFLQDPATGFIQGVLREGIVEYSDSQPISRTYDLGTTLSGEVASGSASVQASETENSVTLDLKSLNLDLVPGTFGSDIGVASFTLQRVRFNSAATKRIEVEASYNLMGSVIGNQTSPAATASAFGSLLILDLSSYNPEPSFAQTVVGQAEVGLLDISNPGEVYVPQSFHAWTNRDYLVSFGTQARIGLDFSVRADLDLLLQASATSPQFSVLDTGVTVVRSTTGSNPVAVSDPGSLVLLLGLGFIGLLGRRQAI